MTKYHLASHFSRFNILALATFFLLMPGVTLGLEIGDEAPPFRLPGSDGATHQLSDYLGEKPVVLAFFPKAFTGG
tara:strand:+ start:79 stop:303 length:225 start_codon:yes stop_codon:yes gene_type:complete